MCACVTLRSFKGAGGTEKETTKPSLELNLDSNNAPLLDFLKTVESVIFDYINGSAALIFGPDGLALKEKALAQRLKEVESGLVKFHFLKEATDKWCPRMKLSFLPSGDTQIINKKGGGKLEISDVAKYSNVSALVKIRGIFANTTLISVQLDALVLLVSTAPAVDPTSVFLADIEPADDEVDVKKADAKVSGNKRKAAEETPADEDEEY